MVVGDGYGLAEHLTDEIVSKVFDKYDDDPLIRVQVYRRIAHNLNDVAATLAFDHSGDIW